MSRYVVVVGGLAALALSLSLSLEVAHAQKVSEPWPERKAKSPPEAGLMVETVQAEAPTWCDGYAGEAKKEADRMSSPAAGNRTPFSIFSALADRLTWSGTNDIQRIAWIACDKPRDLNRQKWVAYYRQRWMNTTGQTMAETAAMMAAAIGGEDVAPGLKRAKKALIWRRPDRPALVARKDLDTLGAHFIELKSCSGDYSLLYKKFHSPDAMNMKIWQDFVRSPGARYPGASVSPHLIHMIALASCEKPKDPQRRAHIGRVLRDWMKRQSWSVDRMRGLLEYYATTSGTVAQKQVEGVCERLQFRAGALPWDNALNASRRLALGCQKASAKQRLSSRFSRRPTRPTANPGHRPLRWWLDAPQGRDSTLAMLMAFNELPPKRAIIEALLMPKDLEAGVARELKALKVPAPMQLQLPRYITDTLGQVAEARAAAGADVRQYVAKKQEYVRTHRATLDKLYACERAVFTKNLSVQDTCRAELRETVTAAFAALSSAKGAVEGALVKHLQEPLIYARLTLLEMLEQRPADKERLAALLAQAGRHAHWPGLRRPTVDVGGETAPDTKTWSARVAKVRVVDSTLQVTFKPSVWYEEVTKCKSGNRVKSVTRRSGGKYSVDYGENCRVVGRKKRTEKVPPAVLPLSLKTLLKRTHHVVFTEAGSGGASGNTVWKIFRPAKAKRGEQPSSATNSVVFFYGFDLSAGAR